MGDEHGYQPFLLSQFYGQSSEPNILKGFGVKKASISMPFTSGKSLIFILSVFAQSILPHMNSMLWGIFTSSCSPYSITEKRKSTSRRIFNSLISRTAPLYNPRLFSFIYSPEILVPYISNCSMPAFPYPFIQSLLYCSFTCFYGQTLS